LEGHDEEEISGYQMDLTEPHTTRIHLATLITENAKSSLASSTAVNARELEGVEAILSAPTNYRNTEVSQSRYPYTLYRSGGRKQNGMENVEDSASRELFSSSK
jgi:hypothetical protein